MINQKLAKIFKNISTILEIKEDSRFRVVAYDKASDVIGNLTKDLKDVYKEGGIKALKEVPGVGQSIAEKIEEYIKKGKIKEYEDLKKDYPESMLKLTEIPDIGPKTAAVLYKELKIDSIVKLEKAAKAGAIQKLPNFKEQSEKNILRGIKQYRVRTKERNRLLLSEASAIADELITYIKKNKTVKKIDPVGSLRRMKETVGDVDLVIATDKAKQVIDYIANNPFVYNILSKGDTKISFTHFKKVRIDVEILPQKDYGSLLQHFTGSKAHNVHLRTWASEKKLSISEYGIKDEKKNKLHHFKDEKSFYEFVGMNYIEPELREDSGEIEAALADKLPKIIGYNDIKGDLHCHTNLSDGVNTIEEVAQQGIKMKYKYLGISDHTAGLGVASGLNDKEILKHKANIDKANKKYKNIRLLSGAEINITAKGDLDLKPATIKKLDFSIGSVHSAFNQDKTVMTKRIIKAIESGINILGHPTGRKIGKRPAYEADWDAVFKAAAKNKVALEINSYPERLDLKDILIKQALQYGCKFCIDTDSHSIEHFKGIKYGIAQARRGWATKNDIINSWDLTKLIKWFKK